MKKTKKIERILITGGAGFIGHQLIDYFLKTTDYELVVLESLTYAGDLNRITRLGSYKENPSRVKFVYHNLRSPINDLVAKSMGLVDYIVHMAANSSVEDTIRNPEASVLDNVLGTVHVLQFARTDALSTNELKQKNLKLMLYFSTDEVYGPAPEGVDFDEEAPHKPSNPYSAGKAGGEDYCHAFEVTYGVPVATSNMMNVFGFDQHPEKFIPTVIRSLQKGEVLPIYADSTKTKAGSRFWIFSYDVADAVLFLLKNAKVGEKYHVVGTEKDNLELAQGIAKSMGKELQFEMKDFHSSRPGHDMRYSQSGKKIKKMGWRLKYGLDKALEEIVPTYLE